MKLWIAALTALTLVACGAKTDAPSSAEENATTREMIDMIEVRAAELSPEDKERLQAMIDRDPDTTGDVRFDLPKSGPADDVVIYSSRETSLPDTFNCLRENKAAVIASHRGGPAPGYPENGLETLKYGFDQGIRVFEIDVAETRDGTLTLMHDDRINRTTTGDGYIADTSWEELSKARLVDNDGKTTNFRAPRLKDVLEWAKSSGAILELDKKNTTSYRNIVAAVKAAGAENNVLLISYTDQHVQEIIRAAPDMMLTATARGSRDIAKLEGFGVKRENLVAWTGTREADAAAWARNSKEGVESAFGTLGRPGQRLDDVYWADGKGDEYQKLAEDGLVMISTDTPYKVIDAITADDVAREKCGL